jgi:hypothetical protein
MSFGSMLAFLYGSMAILGHSQGDDFRTNAKDVLRSAAIVYALLLIPGIGVILALVYLYRHYDLSLSEMVIIVLSGVVFATVLAITVIPVAVSLALLLS